MSGTSWLDWSGPEGLARRGRFLEERAALAFFVIALLNLPGIIVSPWGGPPAWLLNTTAVGASIGITAVYLVTARAIERRRTWAVVATRPLLVVVAVFGIYSALLAAQQGWVKVPIDSALAIWAWFGQPDPRPPDAPTASPVRGALWRTASAVLVVALLQVVIWFGPPVFGWGGLLDVHQPDFTGSLQVDCGPPGGPPPTLTVTYDWSWHDRAWFPSGLDVVVVGWRGVDSAGRTLYLLGDTPVTGAGIQPSLQEFPSLDMARDIESQTPGSWHWGIHLDQQNLAPGHIQFTLQLARANPPGPGPMTFTAGYVHLGLWHTDAPAVVCSW